MNRRAFLRLLGVAGGAVVLPAPVMAAIRALDEESEVDALLPQPSGERYIVSVTAHSSGPSQLARLYSGDLLILNFPLHPNIEARVDAISWSVPRYSGRLRIECESDVIALVDVIEDTGPLLTLDQLILSKHERFLVVGTANASLKSDSVP